MRLVQIIVLLLFAISAVAKPSRQQIRLLNWWDYTSPKLVAKMKRLGYNIELETYKSNNVVVSKLINNRAGFDVAIVSNQVLPDLLSAHMLIKDQFIGLNRNYSSFTTKYAHDCLPYLWSATIFSVIPKPHDHPKVHSLDQLLALSAHGYKIGVIDDKLEVYDRLVQDHLPTTDFHPPLQSFTSSTGEILTRPGSAAYGWDGAIEPAVTRSLHVEMQLPKGRIIEGYDTVCLVNNKMSRMKLKSLVAFVKKFTDHKNTAMSAKYSQYFSPYVNDTRGLNSQFAKLRARLLERNKTEPPVVISPLPPRKDAQVSSWWRTVRYEK